MGNSHSLTQFLAARSAKSKGLAKLLASLSESQMETFEILSDAEQATDLLMGMMEAQQGQVVPFDLAFADL